MHILVLLLKHGWRALTEAHTITWLLAWTLIPSATITSLAAWYSEHSIVTLLV